MKMKLIRQASEFWRTKLHTRPNLFLSLPRDCLGMIIEFMRTEDWIQFSYVNRTINQFKHEQHLMIFKCRTVNPRLTLKEIEKSLKYAKGTLFNVNLRGSLVFTDDLFQYFQGTIHTLDMSGCWRETITDKAFSYLQGTIQILNMANCNQRTITDEAFSYLKDTICDIDLSGCNQTSITDRAFLYLTHIRTLIMSKCNQSTITPEAITYLSDKIQKLDISGSQLESKVDDLFSRLPHTIEVLVMSCKMLTDKTKALIYLRALPLKALYLKDRDALKHSKLDVDGLLNFRICYI